MSGQRLNIVGTWQPCTTPEVLLLTASGRLAVTAHGQRRRPEVKTKMPLIFDVGSRLKQLNYTFSERQLIGKDHIDKRRARPSGTFYIGILECL